MSGNVRHDYRNQEYVQALEELSTPHYDSSQGKIESVRAFISAFPKGFKGAILKTARRLKNFVAC